MPLKNDGVVQNVFHMTLCVSAASPLIRLLIFRKSGELFHKANSFQRLFLMVHICMYGHTFLRKLIKRVLALCLSLPSFFYTCKSTLKARCNRMWWLISRTGVPCKLVIQFTVHWNIHCHCRLKCCYFEHLPMLDTKRHVQCYECECSTTELWELDNQQPSQSVLHRQIFKA